MQKSLEMGQNNLQINNRDYEFAYKPSAFDVINVLKSYATSMYAVLAFS